MQVKLLKMKIGIGESVVEFDRSNSNVLKESFCEEKICEAF